ncbi:zinc finger MYM-type protein 5-like isoform X2 [Myzus persicae]|uniref:zinc finger MYM-type protein 5-like isoform X2 n=1 Tax=Myzus persicae TaxID=13164 RepID=UPI000B937F10|nr:zinc finger MYM-type protein 5-like isoform X2 [Myzus persicae]
MSSRDRDKFRSYPSGNAKRQKKNIRDKSLNKMRGSINKYVNYKFDTPSSSIEIDNEVEINKLQTESNNSGNDFIINTVNDYDTTDYIENDKFDTPSSSIKIDNEVEINKLQTESKRSSNNIIINTVNDYDMTDIGCWPEIINNDFRKELIKLGPIQVKSYNFPQSEINGELRRFNPTLYDKRLDNGDVIKRNWLVYSKFKDRAFCFCCKLFDSHSTGNLSKNGINDWRHIGERLKSHEITIPHYTSLQSWIELKQRISELNTIDKLHLTKLNAEKQHWG